MSHEFLVLDSIVETVPIGCERPKTPARSRPCEGDRLSAGLRRLCALESDFPLLLNGRAHFVVYGPSGAKWVRRSDGGCEGHLVLAPRDQPTRWIRIGFKLAKGREPEGWLTIDYVPTTILTGDNVYPATFADAHTGEIDALMATSTPMFPVQPERRGRARPRGRSRVQTQSLRSAGLHAMSFKVARNVLPRWTVADQRRAGTKTLNAAPAERRAPREEPPTPNVRGRQPRVAPPPRASGVAPWVVARMLRASQPYGRIRCRGAPSSSGVDANRQRADSRQMAR